MKKQLLRNIAVGVAGLVISAQAQSSGSSGSPGGSQTEPSGSSYGSSSSSSSKSLSPTGRMGHHEARASQLTGALVTSSSGETLGTINDILLSPSSGKIDFAVISLISSAGSSAPGSSSTSSTSGTSATGEKLVPVPWSLLRPSSESASSPSSTSGMAPMAFTFTGDKSKLDAAPSFSQSNWPDFSQPSWKHSIFSYYGMTPSSATGGSESPGGAGSSSGSGSSSKPPGSSGTP